MQRTILILSVVLIVCALAGMALFAPKASVKQAQQSVKVSKAADKKSFTYLVAKEDIYAATPLGRDNVGFEELLYEDELPKQFKELFSKAEFENAKDYAALKNIEAGQKIAKNLVIDMSSPEYAKMRLAPENGLLSFAFGLDERQFGVVENVKPSGYVDVFFRYETKNAKKDEGIAPKKRKDSDYRNYETANTTTLMPLFLDKRVLFKQRVRSDEKDKNAKEADVGQIFIELSQDEAKKIYAIENLGNFFIFPAQKGGEKVVSTQKVLQKEFIKELRGGSNANQ